MNTPTKETIVQLLSAWIRQRPGLDYRNYCSGYGDDAGRRAYFAEVRSIGKDLQIARQLLRAVELSGITAEELAAAFSGAYSGRLSLVQCADGAWALDYCAGQYWPTEYRRAACAVLAQALWAYKREHCMPAPTFKVNGGRFFTTLDKAKEAAEKYLPAIVAIEERYQGISAGDYLRAQFRREFGRGIQQAYFD